MKYEFRNCRIFLLVNALSGFLSDAEIISKFVCPGHSVQVFQNIAFNNCSSVVSLYTNGDRYTLIARWSLQNCSRNETLLPDYKERVFLYGNGTISIHNIHPWDQAKYVANCQMRDFSTQDVVLINVMAAPTKDCRPKILHLGKSLFASLKANFCGKPLATLYWKGYGDVSNTSEPVLKLTPGNEAGTYNACIKGPALQCARNSTPLDYCSSFTIGGDSTPISSETFDVKEVIFILVIIVLVISLILAIAVIFIRRHCRKTISAALKKAVVNRVASGDAHVRFCGNETRTGGREVNDRDYDPGSSRAIIEYENYSEETEELLGTSEMPPSTVVDSTEERQELLRTSGMPPSTVVDSTDSTLKTEATTKDRRNHNSNDTREKWPNVDGCAFCEKDKVTMFVLRCTHAGSEYMPTCTKCGVLSRPFGICSASNNNDVHKQYGHDFKSYMLTKLKL